MWLLAASQSPTYGMMRNFNTNNFTPAQPNVTTQSESVPGRELLVGLLLMTAAKLGRGAEVIGNSERGRRNADRARSVRRSSDEASGRADGSRREAEESGRGHWSGVVEKRSAIDGVVVVLLVPQWEVSRSWVRKRLMGRCSWRFPRSFAGGVMPVVVWLPEAARPQSLSGKTNTLFNMNSSN